MVATISAVEILLLLPVKDSSTLILATAGKAAKTMTAKHVSDHWKEAALAAYAKRLCFSSISLLIFILIATSPIIIIGIACAAVEVNFFSFISTPLGIVVSTILALIYLPLRRQFIHGAL